MNKKILPPSFYRDDTVEVAKNLLGKVLVREINGQRRTGIIVETEAYTGSEDPACHGYNYRRTNRTRSLFLPGGFSYVYFIYRMYFCFNVVTKDEEHPEAVLIRAIEPIEGTEAMLRDRKVKSTTDIASGPGKLCLAMNIDRKLDGLKLNGPEIYVEDSPKHSFDIGCSARIGIGHKNAAKDWPLRFFIQNNPHVSKLTLSKNKR